MCDLVQATTSRQELRVAALFQGNMDAGTIVGRGPVNQLSKYPRIARCTCGEKMVIGGLKFDADVMRQTAIAYERSLKRRDGKKRNRSAWARY